MNPQQEYRFWSRNSAVLDNPKVNPTFKEVLHYSDDELREWVKLTRKTIIEEWDNNGTPPLNGKDYEGLIEDFKNLSNYPVHKLAAIDELNGKKEAIVCPIYYGNGVNQWFENMMKAKINYSTKGNGFSIYDIFKDDKYFEKNVKYWTRQFQRDSLYRNSISVEQFSKMGLVPAKDGISWIRLFHNKPTTFKGTGFWLSTSSDNDKGSGYTSVDSTKYLRVNKEEIQNGIKEGLISVDNFPKKQIPNELEESYLIRFFYNDTRIFPVGFTALKISFCQMAVNFPPLIAKYIYTKYTEHIKNQKIINIYDPSAGWGGRIIGAMATNGDRKIHYIGTDPNSDNYYEDIGLTKYSLAAQFFNDHVFTDSIDNFFSDEPLNNTFEIYRSGSEVIHKNRMFQRYCGKLDMVFTSPPYFSKEKYSEDEEQSCIKFSDYTSWRDGFLRPTLETCVEYLRKNRYLCWNIADVHYDNGTVFPLEQDSIDILTNLGMEYVETLKMVLASAPGANRMGEDGKPTCKNYCKVDSKYSKMEPIFVFRKP